MLSALEAALRAQLRPRMLALALLPFGAALLLWILVDAVAWHPLVESLRQGIGWSVSQGWVSDGLARKISEWLVLAAMLIFLWPFIQATALLITATIAMPFVIDEIAARDFPGLERRHGGSTLGSVWNALAATAVFLLLWLLTLPLWLFALPALVLPIVLSAWLNARLFRYDALAEHASAEEMALIRHRSRGQWFGLGVVAALLQLVPVLNLLITVYSGLSFAYLGLNELQQLRAQRPS
jgi:hypothetical protein